MKFVIQFFELRLVAVSSFELVIPLTFYRARRSSFFLFEKAHADE